MYAASMGVKVFSHWVAPHSRGQVIPSSVVSLCMKDSKLDMTSGIIWFGRESGAVAAKLDISFMSGLLLLPALTVSRLLLTMLVIYV